MIHLHHIALVVSDAARAKEFYQKVFGFPEINRASSGASGNAGAWLKIGSIELHLQERKGITPNSTQHFALHTDSLEEIKKRGALAGARIEDANAINGLSQRCFIYDLDGNRLELMQA